MSRRSARRLVSKIILATLLIQCALPASKSFGHTRALSLDDILAAQELSSAVFDPTGRWLFFEKSRPYSANSDFSYGSRSFGNIGHQVWRLDTANAGPPELLPSLDQEPSTYIKSLSPTGRFLLLAQYRHGRVRLVSYDLTADASFELQLSPALFRGVPFEPIWISDSELVYSSTTEGEDISAAGLRAHTGRTLLDAWNAAWRGDTVTASEVRTTSANAPARVRRGGIVRVDVETGEYVSLAQGRFVSLKASPDGKRIAALRMAENPAASSAATARYDPRQFDFWIVDASTGDAVPVAEPYEFAPYTIEWSAQHNRLTAFGWLKGGSPENGRFLLIDPTSGKFEELRHTGLDLASERERGYYHRPERAVPFGSGVAVFARKIADGEDQEARFSAKDVRPDNLPRADWYLISPENLPINLTEGLSAVSPILIANASNMLLILSETGVHLVDSHGKKTQITPLEFNDLKLVRFSTFEARGNVVRPSPGVETTILARSDTSFAALIVNFDEEQFLPLKTIRLPGISPTIVASSYQTDLLFVIESDGLASAGVLIGGASADQARPVVAVNQRFEDIEFGVWQEISYSASDPSRPGREVAVSGCLLLPPVGPASKPPPMIVDVYPNVSGDCPKAPTQSRVLDPLSPYLWAANGFAYFRPATPRSLIQTTEGPIAGMDEIVGLGIDAVVQTGHVNPEEISLFGFSQGGFSALYIAAKALPVRRVIAMNGWSNMYSHYYGAAGVLSYVASETFGNFGRYDIAAGSDFAMGRSPTDDPLGYIANSPVSLAADIAAPVMLVHTDMDAFSMSQFDEMYGALLKSGKNARYVRYWGEGHGPSSPANIRDLWKRMIGFLKEDSKY